MGDDGYILLKVYADMFSILLSFYQKRANMRCDFEIKVVREKGMKTL